MATMDKINAALLNSLIPRLEKERAGLGPDQTLDAATGKALRSRSLILNHGTADQVHDVCLILAENGTAPDVNWVAKNLANIQEIVDPGGAPVDDDEDDETEE